jgi:hypothetical protein
MRFTNTIAASPVMQDQGMLPGMSSVADRIAGKPIAG